MTQLQERPTAPSTRSPPSPPTRAGRRDWQRVSLFAGGIAFAVGNLLHPLEHTEAAYHSATWQAAHLTIFFSIPLLVLGLPYLHRRLATTRVSPMLATVAVAASMAGLIGIAPGTVIEAFVAPMIGHARHGGARVRRHGRGQRAPRRRLPRRHDRPRAGRSARPSCRPRWAGPSLIVGAVVLLGVMSATGPAAGVVIITATVVYGLALAALAVKA